MNEYVVTAVDSVHPEPEALDKVYHITKLDVSHCAMRYAPEQLFSVHSDLIMVLALAASLFGLPFDYLPFFFSKPVKVINHVIYFGFGRLRKPTKICFCRVQLLLEISS